MKYLVVLNPSAAKGAALKNKPKIEKLLPVEYRGYYSDLSKTTTNYLDFNIPITRPMHQPWWQKVANAVRKCQSSFEDHIA